MATTKTTTTTTTTTASNTTSNTTSMTTMVIPEAGGHRGGGQLVVRASFAAVLALGMLPTNAQPVDKCVKDRMAAGESRSVALAACLSESNAPTTIAPGANLPGISSSGDDDGTSAGLLVVVGLGGLVLGAVLATALRRRTSTPPAVLPLPVQPAGVMPAGTAVLPLPPAMSPPAAAPDRTAGLVTALIDLADRVPSQALRAEMLAALSRAGVHSLEPATGDVFDATRMRGVSSAPAPDASWVGRVASTDRAGYRDGATVVRVPEVVVYTAEG